MSWEISESECAHLVRYAMYPPEPVVELQGRGGGGESLSSAASPLDSEKKNGNEGGLVWTQALSFCSISNKIAYTHCGPYLSR